MEPADVLDPDELQDVASTFGVDENQVLRDHLIGRSAISAARPGSL
jgi:uncharacterized protein YidB (DUF937 family)